MTKETITYTDLNGVQRTEDFYFDLSKPEIVKMQASARVATMFSSRVSLPVRMGRLLWSSSRTLLRPPMARRAMMADAS